jgi:uracil phosphoribosyltransferase
MLFTLSEHHSIANQFMYELRDKTLQQDRMRFRRNIERLGEILAYEISKNLPYDTITIETPLTSCSVQRISSMPVILTILRAGLPFAQGFLNFFDKADAGFIGAYREEGSEKLQIQMDYLAIPPLQNRDVILVDPMLATGSSVVRTLEKLMMKSTCRSLHLAAVISTREGIRNVTENCAGLSVPLKVYTAAIDEELNKDFYIVPGLGDAGDLSFGMK